MFSLVLSIFLLCFNLAFCSNPCLSQTPCQCILPNDTIIDLSSVGSPDYPRFYSIPSNTNCSINDLYSYNPCFAFDSPDKHTTTKSGNTPCTGASACVKGPGGAEGQFPEEHAIGLQYTGIFGVNDSTYYINYTVPGMKKILKVQLKCDDSSSESQLNIINPGCSADSELIILELTSKCACPNGCQSSLPSPPPTGLSTGSKLLIAFFTILLAYLLIGVVWNFCHGSHGADLIPNLEFWNDLPTLIMEGVTFACSCCISKSSYGEV